MHNNLNQNFELTISPTAEQLERQLAERARQEFKDGRANSDTTQFVTLRDLEASYNELATLPARNVQEYARRARVAVAMSFLHEQQTFQNSGVHQGWHAVEQQRFGYTTEVVKTTIAKGQVRSFYNNGSPVIIKTLDAQGAPDVGTLFISPEGPMNWRVHRLERAEYSRSSLDFRDVTPSSPEAVVTVENVQVFASVGVGPEGALYVFGQSDTPVNTEQVQLSY